MRRRFSREYVGTAAHRLGVLSQETRLHLVLALAQGPASVTELCEHLELPQSNISHHLSILRNTGLVVDSREGQFVIYRINIAAWRMLGDGFFDQLLGGRDEVMLQHFQIRRLGPTSRAWGNPAGSNDVLAHQGRSAVRSAAYMAYM